MLENSRYDIKITPDYTEVERKKYKGLTYTNPIDYNFTSRYAKTKCIYDENSIEYHETYKLKPIPENETDTTFRVDNATENRLDIIAFKKYGFSIYWWVIAMANDIIDPFNVPVGTLLRIPAISSLYVEGGLLK